MELENTILDRTYAVLKQNLLQRMPAPGDYPTPIPGFVLHRRDVTNKPENCFNRPILAVTIQGSKRTWLATKSTATERATAFSPVWTCPT